MFVFTILFTALISTQPTAAAEQNLQDRVDNAFQLIMRTHIGHDICQMILGAQADAIEFHLGVSSSAAKTIARECDSNPDESPHPWIYATTNQDIHKLTLKAAKPRKYKVQTRPTGQHSFPIESWTDPFTNTTVLMVDSEELSDERLVQLLAHEMAVYFDGKANPAHPEAQSLPQLRDLKISTSAKINPLVALSNPLIAHTLTYIRALQIEFAIVEELVQAGKIQAPTDHQDPYLNFLISDRCSERCLEQLVLTMRKAYLPLGLAFLAFAPHYRSLLAQELPHAQPTWTQQQWSRLQFTLDASVAFLNDQFSGNPLADLQHLYAAEENGAASFSRVAVFLSADLWPLEWPALHESQVAADQTLLEFMKVPLLSGYNVLLSSGPRVRVRTGNVE